MQHDTQEVVLSNGARGLLVNVPNATVMSFDFELRAGYYLVDREKWEAPHIMEHMLLGANSRIKNARKFYAEFQKNGAYSNASTSTYSIHYIAECADFEWDRILDLMTLSMAKPLFLESEFAAEYGNVRDELSGDLNNHFRNLSLRMQEAFGVRAMTDHDRIEQMKSVKLQDVVDHYKNTHGTNNIRFIISGKIRGRKSKIVEMLESGLRLKRGERFELPDEMPQLLQKPHYVHDASVNNIYFFFDTFIRQRISQRDRDSLSLLNTMLTATLHSLILGEAREKGLVYSMGSNHISYKNATGWWFGAQVVEENSHALFDIISEQLTKVLKGHVKQSDIDAAKQYALGRYQRGAQTVAGLAQGYAEQYYFDETIESYYRIPERIEAVTKQRVIDVARQMFADNVWGIGVLGSCGEKHADELREKISTLWDNN